MPLRNFPRVLLLLLALGLLPTALAGQVTSDSSVVRRQVTAGRVLLFTGIGFLGGAALGVAYGAADHPGLPHKCCDIPPTLEYVLEFALVGAVAGGVLGALTAPRQARIQVIPYVAPRLRDSRDSRRHVQWGAQVSWRF